MDARKLFGILSSSEGAAFPSNDFQCQQCGTSITVFNFVHSEQKRIRANWVSCPVKTCLC